MRFITYRALARKDPEKRGFLLSLNLGLLRCFCVVSQTPWLAFDLKRNTFREDESVANIYILLAFYLSSSNSETGNNFLSLSGTGFLMAFVFSKR